MIICNHGVVITWMLWTWSVSVLLTSWIFSLLPTPLQWWSNTMGCEILLLTHLKEVKMLINFEVAWLNMLLGCFFVILNSFFTVIFMNFTDIWSHQFNSVAQSCPTLSYPMDCSTPGFPTISNSWQLLKLIPSSRWCHPAILSSVVPFSSCLWSFRVFSSESGLRMRWPKYWSFSFIISPSNEYSGLISFRMDWLDLLADQGTLESLLQHHSSKASILQCSAFFIIQLSHPYMTTRNP